MNKQAKTLAPDSLDLGQIVLCSCPEWNDLGFQVAEWDGKKFHYEEDPNGTFDEYVEAFYTLDELIN